MRFLKKLKSGNFWVSLISCGVLIAEVVFDFEIKTEYLNQILLGLMGLLTVCGIVTDHGATDTLIANLSSNDDTKQENNQENISNIKSICDTISLMLNKVSINSNNEKVDDANDSTDSTNACTNSNSTATACTNSNSGTTDYANSNSTTIGHINADCINADSRNICLQDENDDKHIEGEQVNKSDILQEIVEANPTTEITTQDTPEPTIDIVNK